MNDAPRLDPFFHLPMNSQWNACIGRQAHEENYIDGYIEAALELTNAILSKRLFGQRDTLVLPVLHSARHAVELTLKFVTRRLQAAGVLQRARKIDHDIAADYAVLAQARLGDVALRKHVDALAPYVASLAAIDRDGQMLRYSRSRSGAKSMGDRSLANIEVMHVSCMALKDILGALKRRADDIVDERKTGTFTPDCSRQDLMEIAHLLPPRAKWSEAAFDDAKTLIKARFAIGSNKFSTALKMIEAHREMGGLLGLSFPLKHLTDEHAIFAVSQWRLRHPPRMTPTAGVINAAEIDWSAMREHARLDQQTNEAILAKLSADQIADLDTIFYMGRDRVPCEYYEAQLETTQKHQSGDIASSVDHILSKPNFALELDFGFRLLGRPDLAARIQQTAAPAC